MWAIQRAAEGRHTARPEAAPRPAARKRAEGGARQEHPAGRAPKVEPRFAPVARRLSLWPRSPDMRRRLGAPLARTSGRSM
jgi:hypothetical protein